jgi:hypothetical protein
MLTGVDFRARFLRPTGTVKSTMDVTIAGGSFQVSGT